MTKYDLYQPSKVTGYCTEVPAHWKIMKLKRLISVTSGDFLGPGDESEEGFPIYGGNGMRGYARTFNCTGPVLLIGRVGALCGNVHLVNGQFWYSEHALRVLPLKRISLEYFKYLFDVIDLNQFANRTAQPLINSRTTIDRYAAIPPLQEQINIANYLESACSAIDAVGFVPRHREDVSKTKGVLNTQLDVLAAYRKSLIHECVTGQRRITEADLRAIQKKNFTITKTTV